MNNLVDLLHCLDKYSSYLNANGIKFSSSGYPIIPRDCYSDKEPEMIVPFYHRNDKFVKNPKKTAIAFFDKDKNIYPRFDKIHKNIYIYKKYQAVISPDITVTDDMDIEWQHLILLANQLFMAILAVNDIKIIFNTRTGNHYEEAFSHIPHNIICASSTLGCNKCQPPYDYKYLTKILLLLPKKLLIYGTTNKISNSQLNRMGIDFIYYPDFHTLSKEARKNVR